MKVLVASTNPNKIKGTVLAFREFLKVIKSQAKLYVDSIKVPSGVPAQPIGYDQTTQGAYNRACNAKDTDISQKYVFYVGLESGVVFIKDNPYVVTYSCVIDKKGIYCFGSSILHPLPSTFKDYLAKGKELAEFAHDLSGVDDIRSKGGIVGYLTNGLYTRTDVNKFAVRGALVGFMRREVFK